MCWSAGISPEQDALRRGNVEQAADASVGVTAWPCQQARCEPANHSRSAAWIWADVNDE